MAKAKITEKTITNPDKFKSSERGVHLTLSLSSVNDILIKFIIDPILVFVHGLRDSNSRHLVLETSALPTELNPFIFDTKGVNQIE